MSWLEQGALWLADTQAATALRESEIAFPVIQTFHILGLGLLAGTVAIVDLRLLRLILADRPASALSRQLLPLSWIGFAVMAASGTLLFAAQAARIWSNIYLQAKLVLLLLAGLNMLLFHLTSYRHVAIWGEPGTAVPLPVRGAAIASLFLWAAIITAGRLIAYFG